jgi:hypothetical protein
MTIVNRFRRYTETLRVEQVQFFAGLEADSLAGGDGYLGSGAWVAADTGLARTNVEDAEAAQLDAVAGGEGLFQAFKYRVYRGLCLIAWQTRAFDDVMDDVLFNQRVHPLYARLCLRI